MTQMVTRCPKCATAFRITSTQLESAKGAVRCGSCLHIFKAKDFLVKSVPPETATQAIVKPAEKIEAAKPATAKPAIAPAQTIKPAAVKPIINKAKVLEDEDDVLISDDMDKVDEKASAYEFDGFLEVNLQPKQTVSLFEREIRYEEPKDDDKEEVADESWAQELLDDDEETLLQLKKTPSPIESAAPIKSEHETAATGTSDSKAISDSKATTDSKTTTAPQATNESKSGYSGPIFSLISETTDEADNKEEHNEHDFSEAFLNATQTPAPAPATVFEASESSEFASSLFEAELSSDAQEEKAASKRPVKSTKMRAFDTSRAALLMNIMPAPVEFTAKRMRRWYQQKLWPTLSLLMAALLFFQVAYFKFDYFSRVEPTRTAYLFTCPLFGCEVPPLVDIMEIETTNLIVRNHPKVGDALLVDAILINKAPFEQPFPDLILSFSKIDETPVASRRFTPKEYLGGELAGMKYIPERQPVHISLEIADPGSDAPNFTLSAH